MREFEIVIEDRVVFDKLTYIELAPNADEAVKSFMDRNSNKTHIKIVSVREVGDGNLR